MRKYILSTITDLYFFRLMKFFGNIFWVPNLVCWYPKCPGYSRKGLLIVVWERSHYLEEAEKQLSDSDTYIEG